MHGVVQPHRDSFGSGRVLEYTGIDVTQTADGVSVDLKAKSGELIDRSVIERCLDHTAILVSP